MIFMGMKEKNKQTSKMADSKKLSFSELPILKTFLWKFHGLVLGLVGLIDAKGKKTQKNAFCLFLSLNCTVSQPYRLSHINALRINQFYEPKDQSIKFSPNFFENWQFWKTNFFLSRPFWIFFFKDFFFAYSHENQSKLLGYQG
jgi:hypothetical protein